MVGVEMNQYEQELIELVQQEVEVQFSSFSNETALKIGLMLYEEAKKLEKAVAIDISRNGQCLFHLAMEGTTIDNAQWIRRKNNVVNRFGKSSYLVGTNLRMQGKTIEEKYGISRGEYADHGGAFPLIIKGVGPVGTITVSGLPQKEDHELVVRVLRTYLSKSTSMG
jgi:uncharacterized protein (UPF0303 family)